MIHHIVQILLYLLFEPVILKVFLQQELCPDTGIILIAAGFHPGATPAIMQAALCQHTQSGFPCGFHHVFVQKFLADARRHQQ